MKKNLIYMLQKLIKKKIKYILIFFINFNSIQFYIMQLIEKEMEFKKVIEIIRMKKVKKLIA